MTSSELTGWIAYFGLEPFGEERADLRSGIVAAVIANANRDTKKRREPYQPQDFMMFLDKTAAAVDKTPATAYQLAAILGEHVNVNLVEGKGEEE